MATKPHCKPKPYDPESQYANYRRIRRLLETLLENQETPDSQVEAARLHLETHCSYCGKPLNQEERLQGDGVCMKHSYEQQYNLVFALFEDIDLEVVTC
jgi:hypothetical protein